MTSQDSIQQPGEALPIVEDLSKSPEVVKNGVLGPLSSFPAGPLGPVDCPQTHVPSAPSSVLTGSSTLDGVDQVFFLVSHKALRRISLMFWPPDVGFFFFGSAAYRCRCIDGPSQSKLLFLNIFTHLYVYINIVFFRDISHQVFFCQNILNPSVIRFRLSNYLTGSEALWTFSFLTRKGGRRVTSGQVLEVFRKSCVFHENFLFQHGTGFCV